MDSGHQASIRLSLLSCPRWDTGLKHPGLVSAAPEMDLQCPFYRRGDGLLLHFIDVLGSL